MEIHERDGSKRGGASRRGQGRGAGRGGALVLAGVVALFGSLAGSHGTVQAGTVLAQTVAIASGGDVDEGAPAVFTLTRSGDTNDALSVNVSVAVRVIDPDNLTHLAAGVQLIDTVLTGAPPATVKFAAGVTTVQLSLPTDDDDVAEFTKVISVEVEPGSGYTVATAPKNAAEVMVSNDDDVVVTMPQSDPLPGEPPINGLPLIEGKSLLIMAHFTPREFIVSLRFHRKLTGSVFGADDGLDELVTDPDDLLPSEASGNVIVFHAGGTDDIPEQDGVMIHYPLRPESAKGNWIIGEPSQSVITVRDDDAPRVGIASGGDVTEGESAVFTLTRSADTTDALTVNVSVGESGDALGTPVPMAVTFAANGATAELSVPTVDDAVDEVDAVVTAAVATGTGYNLAIPPGESATVTVADNDLPEVSIAAAGGVTEGEAAVFTLTRSGVTADALTVIVSVSERGDALGAAVPTTVTFAANSATAELSVPTVDDAVDEEDAVVTATLAAGPGYNLAAAPGDSATVTVADNDLPEVSIASAGGVTEGEPAVFTLTRIGLTDDALTVNLSVSQSGDALGSRVPPVVFAANGATAELSVPTVDDAVDEEAAVVTVTLAAGTGYRVAAAPGDSATVTVADNDGPEVSIAAAGGVTEGEPAVFTLTRNGITDDALTVIVSVSESGDALGAAVPTTVTFAANSATAELSVPTVDDAVDEEDAVVTATLAASAGYRVAAAPGDSATVTVADNDLPEISIASAGDVTEGEPAVFTLTRRGLTTDALTVNVSVSQSGDALGTPVPLTATFAANHATAELSVPTVDDAVDEEPAVVTATLVAGTGYRVAAAPGKSATVTVADDDGPEVSIASAGGVTEGEAAVFTLTRSGVTTDALTVNVSVTQRGKALGTPVPLTATFAANGATAELSVPTVDDAVDEEDTVVTATLAAGTGYDLAAAPGDSATVTVADDDLPDVSIASEGDVTEGEPAVFTLTRSGVTTDALTVNVSVSQRGGALGTPVPTTATFAANGATAELSVPTVDDEVDEADTVVTATLAAGTGYRIAAAPGNRATVTVADNDDPEVTVSFEPSTYVVAEGERVTVRAVLSEPPGEETVVPLAIARGDGLTDEDFSGVPSWLVFAAGQTEASFVLAAHRDLIDEEDELVELRFGATVPVAEPSSAQVTLLDTFELDRREQRDRVAEEYLPGLGGTLAGIVTQTLGGRIAEPGPVRDRLEIGGHEVRLAANDNDAPWGTLPEPPMTPSAARADRIAMSFGGRAGDDDGADGSGNGWGIWAKGARAGFARDDGDLAIDGTVISGAAGIEHAGGDWLGGLALFHSRSEVVYEMSVLGERLSDDIEARLTSVIPYLRWSPNEATMVWGAAGRGQGHMTLSDSTGAYEADIEMTMGTFGVSRQVLSEGGFDLAVKSDAFWTHITSDETEGLDGVTSRGWRLRTGLEGGYEHLFDNGARLRPSLEADMRNDGGDVERGTGLEVGGGIAYEHPGLGLKAEASGRVLVLHSDEGYEEWSVAGLLRVSPGADGRGLSFALEPALGAAASGAARLWQDEPFPSPTGEWKPEGRVALSIGYGLPALEPAGRLTPRGRMTFNDDGSRHYGAGFDLTLGPNFVLGVQSAHRFDGNSEHAVQLTSTLRW